MRVSSVAVALPQPGQRGEIPRLRDEPFSKGVRMLFGMLKEWEESLAGRVTGLRLHLSTRLHPDAPLVRSHTGGVVRFVDVTREY